MNTGIQGPTRRKDGYWVCRVECGYKPNGRRNRPSVVRRTKREALAAAKEIRDDYISQGPQALRMRSLTVASLCNDWLTGPVKKLAPRTQDQYAMYSRAFFVPLLGRRRVRELETWDVDRLLTAALAAGSAHYANGALRAFKTMLRHGRRRGANVPDEVLAAQPLGGATSNRLAMTEDQLGRIFNVLDDYPDRSRWYLPLLYATRQGEGLGLTWSKINFEKDTLQVDRQICQVSYLDRRAGTFKYPQGREADYEQIYGASHFGPVKTSSRAPILPLMPSLKRELKEWRDKSEGAPNPFNLVWPREDGNPRRTEADRAQWHEIQQKAEVAHPEGRPYHEHELKHTAATLLTSLDVPISARTAILGHAGAASARPYVHAVGSDVKDALERLDARLQAAPRGA